MFIASGDTFGGFYRAKRAMIPITASWMKSVSRIKSFYSSSVRKISLGVPSETIRYLGEDTASGPSRFVLLRY